MARSDEAAAFFHGVYTAIQQIPHGKVTTYGHIAALIGTRNPPPLSPSPLLSHLTSSPLVPAQRPRQVGVCLKHLPADPSAPFNSQNVPWQRVINAKGEISPRSQPEGSTNQADALRAEGVEVVRGAMGEYHVDFADYGWFPEELPETDPST
ncbi:hypothetical protein S40293_03224 [Stachybotrys chartarum IBT 40293]|nr:hypothetical protein S40293_03224 [Stachybotrys chartarum IBT 40293]